MRGAIVALMLLLPGAGFAQSAAPVKPATEHVVAGLSHDNIGITAAFNGSEVFIYGAVKRNAPEPDGLPLEVIVTLEGPMQPLTVRHKSREWGIWLNTTKVRVAAAPSYYSVATTGPLGTILTPATDTTQRISVPMAMRGFAGPLEVDDARPFTEAMLRIREEEGTYSLREGAVHLVEDTLFRADFVLPANLVEGDYKTRIFLLRHGVVVDSHQAAIYVRRVGLERWTYMMAREHAPIYGALALAIAVLAGWGASAIFRLIRN
ncbi:MAG TPA: TIGR02186 family protein [Paenirhodobacter sp.]